LIYGYDFENVGCKYKAAADLDKNNFASLRAENVGALALVSTTDCRL
jgi:hypothetical protein